MKAQLATLFLVFSYQGTDAKTIRGSKDELTGRHMKSKKDNDKGAYKVVGGKKGFKDKDYDTITFDEDIPIMWLVVKDQKNGRCVSALSEWALDNYYMDLAVVEKDPKKRAAVDDFVIVLDKKTRSDECQELANEIANDPAFSSRKRGVFDMEVQNIAVFDIDPDDKKCDRDCSGDKKRCEDDAATEEEAKECKDDERDCKRDCEDDCKKDCNRHWKGLFLDQCEHAC